MNTNHPHSPHAHDHQPSMADMWNEFVGDPGQLAAEATHQAPHQAAPTTPAPAPTATLAPRARPRPYSDSLAWTGVKAFVQLALVASVILFVLDGGDAPMMALSYVATAIFLMTAMVIADRERFNDRDPEFEIVEYVMPERVTASQPPVALPVRAPLVPLVQQMQVVMPERVSVT